ncbi:MAG: PaaI family thioesterase [Pseudomonadota bacterium]|nr:PaaI family thioesterase [Pseudomonadota bacterium]
MVDYLIPDASLKPDFWATRLKDNLPALLGISTVETTRESMMLELDIRKDHMAPNGFLHAGTVVTLADTATGFSTIANLREGQGFTTIELKSNFFSTALEGRIRAQTTAIHVGRSTHVWDAEVTAVETGKRMALFRCTQMILNAP